MKMGSLISLRELFSIDVSRKSMENLSFFRLIPCTSATASLSLLFVVTYDYAFNLSG